MSGCGFGDLVGFERDAARVLLGLDAEGMSERELAEALSPVLALGEADARVGRLLLDLAAGTLDLQQYPSLARDRRLAQALVLEVAVRLLGAFEADCEAILDLSRAPPRTVLELARRVDESHGAVLGPAVEAQPFERKSLHFETAASLDSLLGLQPPSQSRGEVPGADGVVSGPDTEVPAPLQLLAAFRGAHRARTVFPGAASETAAWRYLPDAQGAFDLLLGLLGSGAAGAGWMGAGGGDLCTATGRATSCLTVPEGALGEATPVRLDAPVQPPPLGPELVPGGAAVRLSPDGLQLARPATLVLPLDAGLLRTAVVRPEAARAYTWSSDEGAWIEVPGSTVDVEARTVTIAIDHFSFYRAAAVSPPVIGIEELITRDPGGLVLQGQGTYVAGAISVWMVARPSGTEDPPVFRTEIRALSVGGAQAPQEVVMVPGECHPDLDGAKLGIAHVRDRDAANDFQYLYFTVADQAAWPCYRLVRWDLGAANQSCTAPEAERAFRVVYDSCSDASAEGTMAAGGLAYRPPLDEPGPPEGGELYVAVKTATNPLSVGNRILRFQLAPDEDGCPAGACVPVAIAGGATAGFDGDGPATERLLRLPVDLGVGTLAVPGDGRDLLLIADTGNHRIRGVNLKAPGGTAIDVAGVTVPAGELVTIAGNRDCGGALGDGCLDDAIDCHCQTDQNGSVTCDPVDVIGGSDAEGDAADTDLRAPVSVAAGPGELYVSERCRHTILVIDASPGGGGLRRLAGTTDAPGTAGLGPYLGAWPGCDPGLPALAPARSAELGFPGDLWVGWYGTHLYVGRGSGITLIRAHDRDDDLVPDCDDNCPELANPLQEDADADGLGDLCDPDADGDGVANVTDNCPGVANPTQLDTDGDGEGDACDSDDDGDGAPDVTDNCPLTVNADQADLDGDGDGDPCDDDDDGDLVEDGADNCPLAANAGQLDTDGDGAGDACDADNDDDGAPDGADNCLLVPNPAQVNFGGGPEGDACDDDDDGDGVPDSTDNCPRLASADQTDSDGDRLGDLCDDDADGDGLRDDSEARYGAVAGRWDTDGDGLSDGEEVNVRFASDGSGEVISGGTDPNNFDTNENGIRDDLDPFPLGTPAEITASLRSPVNVWLVEANLTLTGSKEDDDPDPCVYMKRSHAGTLTGAWGMYDGNAQDPFDPTNATTALSEQLFYFPFRAVGQPLLTLSGDSFECEQYFWDNSGENPACTKGECGIQVVDRVIERLAAQDPLDPPQPPIGGALEFGAVRDDEAGGYLVSLGVTANCGEDFPSAYQLPLPDPPAAPTPACWEDQVGLIAPQNPNLPMARSSYNPPGLRDQKVVAKIAFRDLTGTEPFQVDVLATYKVELQQPIPMVEEWKIKGALIFTPVYIESPEHVDEGRHRVPGDAVAGVPGSQFTFNATEPKGTLAVLVRAGSQITEPGARAYLDNNLCWQAAEVGDSHGAEVDTKLTWETTGGTGGTGGGGSGGAGGAGGGGGSGGEGGTEPAPCLLPKDGVGGENTAYFEGLPQLNDDFGPKLYRAYFWETPFDPAAIPLSLGQAQAEVFFSRRAANHPVPDPDDSGLRAPACMAPELGSATRTSENWFYYWSQVVEVEPGVPADALDPPPLWTDSGMVDVRGVTPKLKWSCWNGRYDDIVVLPPAGEVGPNEYGQKGIDAFAGTLLHERAHVRQVLCYNECGPPGAAFRAEAIDLEHGQVMSGWSFVVSVADSLWNHFIDANGNGIRESGEVLLDGDDDDMCDPAYCASASPSCSYLIPSSGLTVQVCDPRSSTPPGDRPREWHDSARAAQGSHPRGHYVRSDWAVPGQQSRDSDEIDPLSRNDAD